MIIILEITLLFYAAAVAFYMLATFWKTRFFQRSSWWVFFAGGAFHLVFTITRMVESRRWPFLGMFESFSFMALMLTVVYLFTEKRHKPGIHADTCKIYHILRTRFIISIRSNQTYIIS